MNDQAATAYQSNFTDAHIKVHVWEVEKAFTVISCTPAKDI